MYMYIYIYVCIYIYICINIYTWINMYTYINIYTYGYKYVYIYICMCIYIYIYMQIPYWDMEVSWNGSTFKSSIVYALMCDCDTFTFQSRPSNSVPNRRLRPAHVWLGPSYFWSMTLKPASKWAITADRTLCHEFGQTQEAHAQMCIYIYTYYTHLVLK